MSKNIFSRFIFSVLLICICIFSAGCCKSDIYVSIDRSGNAEIVNSFSVVDELYSLVGAQASERLNEINSEEDDTRRAETFSENGYTGLRVTTKVRDIATNDIGVFNDNEFYTTNLENGRYIDVTKSFFVTKYVIDMMPHFDSESRSMNLNLTFTVKIPVKASLQNADEVDESTNEYTWHHNPDKCTNLYLAYSTINVVNVAITLLLLTLLIAGIVIAVIVCVKKKLRK